jgi:leader peptidase (prepilin peptidase)/N-methyltransferase
MGAPVLTAIWAVAVAFRGRAATVPHGPSMCAAAAAAVAIVII